MEKNISETIGCDLGDKTSAVCVLGADGRIKQQTSLTTTRRAMLEFFARDKAHVVIEVGAHSRWVSQLLTNAGHRVTVANPRRVPLISANNNKTDSHDAELLARLGRADAESGQSRARDSQKHRRADTRMHDRELRAQDVGEGSGTAQAGPAADLRVPPPNRRAESNRDASQSSTPCGSRERAP